MTASTDVHGDGIEAIAPMSDLQRYWWARERLRPHAALTVSNQLRVRGELDPELLDAALTDVVRRHEALRTNFARVDGEPAQVIRSRAAAPHVTWTEDLSGLTPGARDDSLRKLVAAERERGFALDAEPLLRLGAVRCAPSDWLLVLSLHHIVADGWAVGLVWRDLSTAYRCREEGVPWPLADDAAPRLRDWVEQERQRIGGRQESREIRHWRNALRDVPPLHIPYDVPPGPSVGFASATRPFAAPPDVSARLGERAAELRVTPFMVTLAAFMAVAGERAGLRDVTVLTFLNRRGRPGTRELVGCIMNAFAIRAELPDADADAGPAALVHRVRDSVLGAYEHQEISAQRVWREVRFSPDTVDLLFMFDQGSPLDDGLDFGGHPAHLAAVEAGPETGGPGPAGQNLVFRVEVSQTGVSGLIEYNARLYRPATMDRLVTEYLERLGEIVG